MRSLRRPSSMSLLPCAANPSLVRTLTDSAVAIAASYAAKGSASAPAPSARRAAAALRGVIPVKVNHHRRYTGYPEGHLLAGREDHISPLLKRLRESATIEHPARMRALALAAFALLGRSPTAPDCGWRRFI